MIVLFEYQGSPIQLEEQNGQIMANATLMCKAFGKKPFDWLQTDQTQRYISAVATSVKTEVESCYETRNGGNDQGTWIYQKLVLNLARWLSPEFEIWCDDRLAELMRTGRTELAGRGADMPLLSGTIAQLSVSNTDMARCMQSLVHDVAEIRARLEAIPVRDMKPQSPVPADKLPLVAARHIQLFWDALSRYEGNIGRMVTLRKDTQYLYFLPSALFPLYADYCAALATEPLACAEIKKCLSHRRYAPYIPIGGKNMTFRYERRGTELYIGGRHLPVFDEKVTG